MKELVSIYKKSVDKNLKDIKSILEEKNIDNPEVFLSCKKMLELSSDNTVNKWLSGRKYVRTAFVKEAFGKYYPKKYIEVSLLIDAIINILDDLVDERFNDEEKAFYIFELSRCFSLYNLRKPKEKLQISLGDVFNELISLVITEKIYQNIIAVEKDLDKIIEYSLLVFNCRSMDINIFNDIALLNIESNKALKEIEKISRIFRAINILKKDINDINYDKERSMESVVTLMKSRKDHNFNNYVKLLVDNMLIDVKNIKDSAKSFSLNCKFPIDSYYKMIQRDKKEIFKAINV